MPAAVGDTDRPVLAVNGRDPIPACTEEAKQWDTARSLLEHSESAAGRQTWVPRRKRLSQIRPRPAVRALGELSGERPRSDDRTLNGRRPITGQLHSPPREGPRFEPTAKDRARRLGSRACNRRLGPEGECGDHQHRRHTEGPEVAATRPTRPSRRSGRRNTAAVKPHPLNNAPPRPAPSIKTGHFCYQQRGS